MAEDEMSKEEKEQLEKDIQEVKQSLSSKDKEEAVKAAKEEGRKEAEKDAQLKETLSSYEKSQKELEQKLKQQQEDGMKQLEELKGKLNEMAESKAHVEPKNPFVDESTDSQARVDSMSDDDLDAIEEASKQAFFDERQNK
jgi:small-conductance mechanosensitive channel